MPVTQPNNVPLQLASALQAQGQQSKQNLQAVLDQLAKAKASERLTQQQGVVQQRVANLQGIVSQLNQMRQLEVGQSEGRKQRASTERNVQAQSKAQTDSAQIAAASRERAASASGKTPEQQALETEKARLDVIAANQKVTGTEPAEKPKLQDRNQTADNIAGLHKQVDSLTGNFDNMVTVDSITGLPTTKPTGPVEKAGIRAGVAAAQRGIISELNVMAGLGAKPADLTSNLLAVINHNLVNGETIRAAVDAAITWEQAGVLNEEQLDEVLAGLNEAAERVDTQETFHKLIMGS